MKNIIAMIGVAFFLITTNAHAEKREIWHGWADMPGIPCSKVFHYKDSFGIRWPSVKMAPQEHHTRIYANIPNSAEIINKAKDCGLVAVGAAGATALILTPPLAWPAFKASFMACAKAQGVLVAANSLEIRAGTECRW